VFLLYAAAERHWVELAALEIVSWSAIASLVLMGFGYLVVQSAILKTGLGPFLPHISLVESFALKTLQLAGNYTLPFVGLSYRVYYLRRVHGLELADIASTFYAPILLRAFVYSLLALLGLFSTLSVYSPQTWVLGASLSTIMFASLVIGFVRPLTLWEHAKPVRALNRLISSWQSVQEHPNTVRDFVLLLAVEYFFIAGGFHFAFGSIGVAIPVGGIMALASVSTFALWFRIAPAALGSFEAAVIYITGIYGASLAEALISTLLVRSAWVVWFLLLSPLSAYLLSKKSPSKVAVISLDPDRPPKK